MSGVQVGICYMLLKRSISINSYLMTFNRDVVEKQKNVRFLEKKST